ncbi:MAG: magnesium transporter [Halobacteriovorax sp.]|nr:magnesium transporter [Halobacteriovorax sp.]
MEANISEIDTLKLEAKSLIQKYKSDKSSIHPFDLKEVVLELRELDENDYLKTLRLIPNDLLAEVIAEMPDHLQGEASEKIRKSKLIKITEEMDTDDAATFIKNVSEQSQSLAEDILQHITPIEQEVIRNLISYDEDVAGAHMQTELFSVHETEVVGDAIKRLRRLKNEGEIQDISQVFILNSEDKFVCSIGVEELVLINPNDSFKSGLDSGKYRRNEVVADHFEDLKEVLEKALDYNLSVIPVVNENHLLLGRITSDDIYDFIESQATEDMYGLAGVNAEVEQTDDLFEVAKTRATWLGVNLVTAILASYVVALFDSTIQSYVSLAILMPIVASMGGNAGTQSLTVTVRQLSIGEIDFEDAIDTLKKEVILATGNGFLFALVIGVLSYLWFKMPLLGVVIALSTVLNLVIAGFFGAVIPLVLMKAKIDPAVASTVVLTTITDIFGFLSFLGLAKILLV